jgi:subtilisin-like proprotein convertase family protein
MVLAADKQTEFIEPITKDGLFYKIVESDSQKKDEVFKCLTDDKKNTVNDQLLNKSKLFSNTQSFKTFRLALSCTAEYTAYFGGTIAGALAGMNATLTRVNAIFDKDLSIKVELIPGTTSLIYTDPATDPYSVANTGSGGAWSLELQNNLTTTIGNDAYDIGHLFGASGGGGNAGCIGCVCVDPIPTGSTSEKRGKGSAYTSPAGSEPEGDAFDVDYVAHEMGHQLGANHTFSHSIEGTGVNVEPGSGSTIMGYAGITNYNVQNNSDDYFTYRSILQIQNNLASKTCPAVTSLSNTPPTISAGPDYTIPKGTPFILTGTGSDAETNSALTYTWEQNDTADNSVTSSSSVAFPTKLKGPNFRSIAPGTSPMRYFPALKTVVTNNLTSKYESVSNVARTLNFVLTGRDNAVNGGQTNSDATVVTINASVGPFDVTSQNTDGISWVQGTTQTITWAVNNTTTLEGSSNVDILLSTDGGLTFPTILKSATPNDGNENITAPNVAAPFCRIMIKPTGNIYFDINPKAFSIGYSIINNCKTYTNNDIVPIPDAANESSSSSIEVTDADVIAAINVGVNITHPYVGDLSLAIVSPNNTRINLLTAQCGSNDNLNIIFSDSGSSLACGTPTNGTFTPNQPLSAITSQTANGTWKLEFRDNGAEDVGTLNSWFVEICTQTIMPLGTKDFSLDNFRIYPNPNNGTFNIAFTSDADAEIKIGVYDISGRQIFNQSYPSTGLFSENLQLNNLQSGIYMVNVQDGSKNEVRKIIVK